jgi:hypothetical protein
MKKHGKGGTIMIVRIIIRLLIVLLTGIVSGYCCFGVGFPNSDIIAITLGQIGLLLSVVSLDYVVPKEQEKKA